MVDLVESFRQGAAYGAQQFDDRLARRNQRTAQNALVARFGPEAYAPDQLVQLDANQRANATTQDTLNTSQNKRVLNASRRVLSFFTNAVNAGLRPDEAFARVEPLLPALGVTPDQIPQFRDELLQNPSLASTYLEALGDENTARVFKSEPVYDRSGKLTTRLTFSDGTTRIVDGATPASAQQGQDRIDISRGNLDVRRLLSSLPYQQQLAFVKENAKSASELSGQLPAALERYNESVNTARQLLDHPGFDSIFGLAGAFGEDTPVVPGTSAAGALSLYRQIGGQAFLRAYDLLRGGGSISEREGAAAQQAASRLRRNLSPEEARQAIEEVITHLERGFQAYQERATPLPIEASRPRGSAPATRPPTRSVFNPATGRVEPKP